MASCRRAVAAARRGPGRSEASAVAATHPTWRSRGRRRPARGVHRFSRGSSRAPIGRAPTAEAENRSWARPREWLAGWRQGPAEPLCGNAASKARRLQGGQGLSQGDSAGRRTGVRNKRHQPVSTGSGPCQSLGLAPCRGGCPAALSCSGKGGWLWKRGSAASVVRPPNPGPYCFHRLGDSRPDPGYERQRRTEPPQARGGDGA